MTWSGRSDGRKDGQTGKSKQADSEADTDKYNYTEHNKNISHNVHNLLHSKCNVMLYKQQANQ